MRAADHIRFALAGLAAPLGILGADAGASYGWQEPRVSSRLLSLHPLPYGRHQSGASRIASLVTLRNGETVSRYVTVREPGLHPLTYTYTLTLNGTDPVNGVPRAPLAIAIAIGTAPAPTQPLKLRGGVNATPPAPTQPLKLRGGVNATPPAPPLKPKRPRRAAPHSACASKRPLFGFGHSETQEGGLCNTPL